MRYFLFRRKRDMVGRLAQMERQSTARPAFRWELTSPAIITVAGKKIKARKPFPRPI
jgi:hypothetical protein